MKRLVSFLGLMVGMAHAQLTNSPGVIYVGSAPSGACTTAPPLQVLTTSGAIYSCNNGTWTNITAGGSGTVTSFTDSSGLFSVATPTSTPTTTYATQSANTAFGNFTGSTAAPSFTVTTGTGSPVAATSPTLVTPVLGTPTSGTITNLTGTCTSCNANIASGTAQTISVAGAASTSPLLMSGAILTGGTGTTNFPALFIQPSAATAVTTWSTSGTLLGMNPASGFAGNLIDARINGSSTALFSVASSGAVTSNSNITASSGTITGNAIVDGSQIGLGANFATVRIYNAGILSWSSTASYNGTQDTGLDRNAAGVVEVNLGTAVGSGGSLKSAGLIAGGTAFTASGCGTAGAITGGASAGSFTVGTGATNCTFTITINGATGLTAPHGWIANADDTTANIHCVNSTTVSTTTVVFVCTGTIATSDLIKWSAIAY